VRTKLLAAGAVAALLPLLLPTAVQAVHSWGDYHWERTDSPLVVNFGDNVDNRWDQYLDWASDDWTASGVLTAWLDIGATNPRTCKAVSGRVEVCNAAYGFNGWLGVAGIYVKGGHITAGYVKVNDSYFDTTTYGTPAWRQFVMCQEVGHAFGLDHQDENFTNTNRGTCMDYTDDPDGGDAFGPSNLQPNDHDYVQLASIYSHSHTVEAPTDEPKPGKGNGGGSGNNRGVVPAGDDESSWGRRVEGSRAEGHSTYVHELGGGRAMITFVTWAR